MSFDKSIKDRVKIKLIKEKIYMLTKNSKFLKIIKLQNFIKYGLVLI